MSWNRVASSGTTAYQIPQEMPGGNCRVLGVCRGLERTWADCADLLRGRQAEDHGDLALAAALAHGQAVERCEHGEDAAHDLLGGLRLNLVLFGEKRRERRAVVGDKFRHVGHR